MRLKQLLLALFLCSGFFSYGQKPYYNQQGNFLKANKVWAFPDSAGIDFNTANRIGIQTTMTGGSNEGAASVADPITGKLLFYSNGRSCWNANHQVMPNGTQLGGNDHVSTVQGAVIVPFIDDENRYFLFSLNDGVVSDNDSIKGFHFGSLFYSVIDMTLDNGKGDIMPGFKNIPIDTTTLSEAMVAIPGNNCDVWLLVHESNEPKYKAYNISSAGVNPTPVVSTTSGAVMPWVPNIYFNGSLAVSPNRALIAMNTTVFGIGGGLTLARFDANTGIVSNELQIGASSHTSGSSAAFSPDNSKLYAYAIENGSFGITQYDVSNYDSNAINASKYQVTGLPDLVYLRLYNDTIYGAIKGMDYISTINNPNNSGAACGFQLNAISLYPGTHNSGTLPTEVISAFSPDTSGKRILDTLICSGYENGVLLNPALVNKEFSYTWNNSTTDTLFKAFEAGTYWVVYGNGCHTFIDTFVLNGTDLTPPMININVHELSTTQSYYSYQWMLDGNIIPGATQRTYEVTANGKYRVIVTNKEGCIDTSEVYTVTNVNSISELSKLAAIIKIYPNPAVNKIQINTPIPLNLILMSIDGKKLLRANNSKTIDVSSLAEGVYILRIHDKAGRYLKTEKIIKTRNK